MKNKICWIFVIISLIFFGCTTKKKDLQIKNLDSPLLGNYTILTKYNQNGEKIDFNEDQIMIINNKIFIGGRNYENIDFKTKVVKIKDYLSTSFNVGNLTFKNMDENTVIVSVFTGEEHICDVIMLTDDMILANFRNSLYLAKYKEKIDKKNYEDFVKNHELKNLPEDKYISRASGIFLGIREDYFNDSRYYTVFLYKKDNDIEIYMTDNIFMPKNNGYVNVNVGKEIIGGVLTNPITINYYPNLKFSSPVENIKYPRNSKYDSKKEVKINFVNNQFISFAFDNYNYGHTDFKNSLAIIPIESTQFESPLTLEQIYKKNAIEEIKNNIAGNFEKMYYDNTNIGILRRNGYWVLVSRLFYYSGNKIKNFEVSLRDANNKIFANENTQSISIAEINQLFSNVEDFTTSQDRNFAIVKTREGFKFVNFVDNKLEIEKIATLQMDNAKIIMNKWYYGVDIENYRKSIIESDFWKRLF